MMIGVMPIKMNRYSICGWLFWLMGNFLGGPAKFNQLRGKPIIGKALLLVLSKISRKQQVSSESKDISMICYL
jgi:hypothetical protein